MQNVSSLNECQAACVQQTPDLAQSLSNLTCKAVEYTAAAGSCRFLSEYVRHTRVVAGAECASITGVDPVNVFVMLPLETLSNEGRVQDRQALSALFDKMEEAGIDGYMTDVWWGITEKQPGTYSFEGYRELFDMARSRSWKVQVVASFHECGSNVGDVCNIPLPQFVLEADGVWYTDSDGVEDKEYISLFADDVEISGRTSIDMYRDWMDAFYHEFESDMGTLITEVMVGMGPSGQLRYPSYQLGRWGYCGIGQFQAFDAHARAALAQAAADAQHPLSWGLPPGLNSTANYSSLPDDTEFFSGGYQTDYGKFFLDWYSGSLKMHGRRVLAQANAVFRGTARITVKLAGIHWWYDSEAHAAEATAGYYNTNGRNAYLEIAKVLAEEGAELDLTCMEMRRAEQQRGCHSDPEGLVRQAVLAAREVRVGFSGENALMRFDKSAYEQILMYRPFLVSFTFFRLSPSLVQPENLELFAGFVASLHGIGAAAGRRLSAHWPSAHPHFLV